MYLLKEHTHSVRPLLPVHGTDSLSFVPEHSSEWRCSFQMEVAPWNLKSTAYTWQDLPMSWRTVGGEDTRQSILAYSLGE